MGCTWCTPSRRSAPAPPPTPNRPPRRTPCGRRHRKPSSRTRSRASAPPTPQKPSAHGSRPPTPRYGPWAPHRPPPPPTTTTPGRERASAREGQGSGKDIPARGRGEAQGSRQASTGTGQRGRHNTGARNHQRARKGKDHGPWHRGRGRNDGHQGAHIGRARVNS